MVKYLPDNCIVLYNADIEALIAADGLLLDEHFRENNRTFYGDKFIDMMLKKHRFVVDLSAAILPMHHNSIMEFMRDYDLPNFKIDEFREYVLGLDLKDFFIIMFNMNSEQAEELEASLSDPELFDKIYSRYEDSCPDYIGFYTFFHQTGKYIEALFTLAKELMTDHFIQFTSNFCEEFEAYSKEVEAEIAALNPMGYTQKLLGKTCKNRGPYERFIFMPSHFFAYCYARYFEYDSFIGQSKYHQQVFITSLTTRKKPAIKDTEAIISILKILSDKTRYQILELLSSGNPVYGLDIVKAMSLAPSTVSHHMEQLKSSGLVIEEPVKQSKYYTINRKHIAGLLDRVAKDLKIDDKEN